MPDPESALDVLFAEAQDAPMQSDPEAIHQEATMMVGTDGTTAVIIENDCAAVTYSWDEALSAWVETSRVENR